ncbi:MAG: hypothetical protein A3G24_20065 [Betaproteobacteria bacterium RIFCSPLOWO2_12_FULL_62_13]|nr:MAG: hypothetical protein A3G24_20065 [Betaproteobacteria bacterium RIFCSPLOWO2_12_FULL_62_13]
MNRLPVTESDLHAYVDSTLPQARGAEVETYLASHSEEAERVAAYRQQNAALHALFDPVLDEAVPERLRTRRARWMKPPLRYAAVVAWVALGGVVGWNLQAYTSAQRTEASTWARRAAIAHAIYSPEVRHPVEVGADQEAHLVNWLSKRLGAQLRAPHLGGIGYTLVGGRLLPGERGPVAQFMYQDAKGQRLTLYVRANADHARETYFQFAQENKVGVFYWFDRRLGYALSGEVDKDELLRAATAVHSQLNP